MMCKLLVLVVAMFSPSALSGEPPAAAISTANNRFTVDLYRALLVENDKGNMIFSPLGVHTVLSMLYQGAGSTTKGALQTSLYLDEPDAVATGYSHLITDLNNVKNVTLYTANKIYVNRRFQIFPKFEGVVKNQFQSSVENIEFKDSKVAADDINGWVSSTTMGKIEKLFKDDDFNDDTALVLLNAIYFKGIWASTFKKENTRPRDFYLDRVNTVRVDMMHKSGGFNMKDDPEIEAQVIQLPFQGNGVSLYVVLPQEDTGIANTERKISQLGINKIFQNLRYENNVRLYLPKFKLETEIDLMGPLTTAGVGILFDSIKCNLRNMVNIDPSWNLYIDKAIQKTFFEVNEEGAEAAAATGVRGIVPFGKSSEAFAVFYADRPFLVLLRASNNTLFFGKIMNPQIEQATIGGDYVTEKLPPAQQMRSQSNSIVIDKNRVIIILSIYCVMCLYFL